MKNNLIEMIIFKLQQNRLLNIFQWTFQLQVVPPQKPNTWVFFPKMVNMIIVLSLGKEVLHF